MAKVPKKPEVHSLEDGMGFMYDVYIKEDADKLIKYLRDKNKELRKQLKEFSNKG